MFFLIGIQFTFGGWISSYAVLMGVSDKTGATFFPVIFWATKAAVMFVVAFSPGTGVKKLQILVFLLIGSGIVSVLLVFFGNIEMVCYISSVL